MKLFKRQDRYDLYEDTDHKVASSAPNPFGKLSKENCDEIFGVVDVEKLAEERFLGSDDITNYNLRFGFKEGFNKAMELYQPTEIEVEIEVEPKENKDLVPLWTYENKLDSNGNLILRKL